MGKLITGTHHICLKPKDQAEFDRTVDFYRTVLGMDVVRSWENGAMLDTGDSLMEIVMEGTGESGRGSIQHFALRTDDVDACCEAVRNAAYEVTVLPNDFTVPCATPYEIRYAFCIGPMGEEIEFFKEY
ncbi:MAG: VOC family protein [Butyricicoccus sp.]